MNQNERLQKLFELLLHKEYSKSEIIAISKYKYDQRQLDRDLYNLKEYYLREDEDLVKSKKGRVVYLSIINNATSLNKNELFNNSITYIEDILNAHKQVLRTRFYELKETDKIQSIDVKIKTIEEAIAQKKQIFISSFKYDATSESDEFQIEDTTIIPKFIKYHRGDFFLIGKDTKEILTFSLSQINSLRLVDEKIATSINVGKINSEMNNRFGITSNYDDTPHHIKLLFSENTGAYISKFLWHPTQKFGIQKNKNYILEMDCGLNRELVGWIFQWMDNVTILEPDVLKKKYNEIVTILNQNKLKNSLVSLNHFPKQKTR